MMKQLELPIIGLCALFILVLVGCDDPEATKKEPIPKRTLEGNPNAPKPDYNGRYPDQFGYQKPEWPREIRKEIYGDPEIFSTPRVQFTAYLKGDKLFPKQELRSLWSMRLDGSDRRLAADPNLLAGGRGLSHTPIRSPNNRYVALSLYDEENKPIRAILELKIQQRWKIADGGGQPNFNWTSDSENIIFYADRNHYNYHIPTKTLTNRKPIYSIRLFLLPDNKQFLAFKSNSYELYNFNSELIKEIIFDFPPTGAYQNPIISPDSERLYFQQRGKMLVVNIQTGETIQSYYRDDYGILGDKLHFSSDFFFSLRLHMLQRQKVQSSNS